MGFDDPQFSYTDEELAERSYDWSAPTLQGITLERLKREGWARLNLPAPDQYAPHAAGGFPTPSGKVELKASMAAGGNFVLPVFRQGSNEFQDGSPVDRRCPAGRGGAAARMRLPLALHFAEEPRVPQLRLRATCAASSRTRASSTCW